MKFTLFVLFVFSVIPHSAWASFPPYSIEGHQIIIDPNSVFSSRLQVVTLQPGLNESHSSSHLKRVGQIVALANHSPNLKDGGKLSWVELDAELTKKLGLHFDQLIHGTPGLAIGLVWVPQSYLGQIHAGQNVHVFRYGFSNAPTSASILSVGKPQFVGEEGVPRAPIVFRLTSGQTWYPGTNCQIEFPLKDAATTQVSTTAILHEGVQEFVMKELSPGHYEPLSVSIISEQSGMTEILGDLRPGDRVVQSGAILLKPVLPELIKSPVAAIEASPLLR